jgi:adenylate cyclase
MKAVLRKRLHALARFLAAGAIIGAGLGGLIQQIDGGPLLAHVIRGMAVGILIGISVGVGEEFVLVGRRIWRSYGGITALRVSTYTLAVLGSLVIVNGASSWLLTDVSFSQAAGEYVLGDTVRRDLVFAVVVAVLGTWFLEVRRLHNPGDVFGFLMGRYRFPVEEKRVFLFADLAGSTGLAERLGPHMYSRFIGDCYRDMSEAILAWRGQVYQYVGDEIIVSWPISEGISDAACVECFFGMRALLADRQERYEELYGCAPQFRGAIHGGPVVITWVGLAKVELAFHGDALNAAARIQGLCSTHGEECLISAPLLQQMSLPDPLSARSLGSVNLRGKDETLEVFALSEMTGREHGGPAAE